MSYQVDADVSVAVTWNDDSNEWEVPAYELQGTLGWATGPTAHPGKGDESRAYAAAERATGHLVTAEDLARMLGSALTQAGPNVNVAKGYRPLSDGLVHMLDAAIHDATGDSTGSEMRGAIIRQLAPIIASVDQNAHLRGVREGKASRG